MRHKGKITPNGVILKAHEIATVFFLAEQGFDITLIPKKNIKGIHTPDIKMCNLDWEMKAPIGEGKYLISNTIQKAIKQSHNIIIDLRRTKRHQTKCLHELEKEFKKSKNIRRLKIITKNNRILDFEK